MSPRRAEVPHLEVVPSDNVTPLAVLDAVAPRGGLHEIPVEHLHPHPSNPRRAVGDVGELADSIRVHGIRQPLLAVPDPGYPDRYRLVIGHRRHAAALAAGLATVPVQLDPDLTDVEQLELMLVENVQRSDLTAVEEADGYQGLLDLGLTVDDVARKTGRSKSTVRQRLQLVALPEPARAAVHEHRATLADALALADADVDDDTRTALADKLGTADFAYELQNMAHRLEREKRWRAWDEAVAASGATAVRFVDGDWRLPDGEKADMWKRSRDEHLVQLTPRYEVPEPGWAQEIGLGEGWYVLEALRTHAPNVTVYRPPTAEELERVSELDEQQLAERAASREYTRQLHERVEREAAEWRQFAEVTADLRRSFLRRLIDGSNVGREPASKVVVGWVADRLLTDAATDDPPAPLAPYEAAETVLTWLGGELVGEDSDLEERIEAGDDVYGPAIAARAAQLAPWQRLLALAAASHDEALASETYWPADAPSWRRESGYPDVATRWYALLEQLGYEVSTAEREHLTPPADEPDPIEDEQED